MLSECNHPSAPAKMTFKILESKPISIRYLESKMIKSWVFVLGPTIDSDSKFGITSLMNDFGFQNLEGHFCRWGRVIAFQIHPKIIFEMI